MKFELLSRCFVLKSENVIKIARIISVPVGRVVQTIRSRGKVYKKTNKNQEYLIVDNFSPVFNE